MTSAVYCRILQFTAVGCSVLCCDGTVVGRRDIARAGTYICMCVCICASMYARARKCKCVHEYLLLCGIQCVEVLRFIEM